MSWLPDWLTGYDAANAAAVNAAQQRLADRQAAAAAAGDDSLAGYYVRGLVPGASASVADDQAAIDQTFGQAVVENANAISGGIRDTLGFSLAKIFGAIPWQLWLLGAVGLFFYMGGAPLLKGILKRK